MSVVFADEQPFSQTYYGFANDNPHIMTIINNGSNDVKLNSIAVYAAVGSGSIDPLDWGDPVSGDGSPWLLELSVNGIASDSVTVNEPVLTPVSISNGGTLYWNDGGACINEKYIVTFSEPPIISTNSSANVYFTSRDELGGSVAIIRVAGLTTSDIVINTEPDPVPIPPKPDNVDSNNISISISPNYVLDTNGKMYIERLGGDKSYTVSYDKVDPRGYDYELNESTNTWEKRPHVYVVSDHSSHVIPPYYPEIADTNSGHKAGNFVIEVSDISNYLPGKLFRFEVQRVELHDGTFTTVPYPFAEASLDTYIDFSKPDISISKISCTTSGNTSTSVTSTTPIVDATSTVTINYSNWSTSHASNETSRVEYKVNDSDWISVKTGTAGNSSGSFSFNPSTKFGISQGSSFALYIRRVNELAEEAKRSDTTRVYKTVGIGIKTYSAMTISNLSINKNPINANSSAKFSWSAWNKVYSKAESATTVLTINGHDITLSEETSWTGKLNSYVPFDKEQQSLTIKITRTHNQTGESVSTSLKGVRVLYTPIRKAFIQQALVQGKYSTSDPNHVGIVTNKTSYTTINLSYCTSEVVSDIDSGNGEYGICTTYEVILKDPNGNCSDINYKSNNVSSYNIYTSSLVPLVRYTLILYPIYSDGTVWSRGHRTVIELYIVQANVLSSSVIDYPLNNRYWCGNTFRVAFKLPFDSDYDYLTDDQKEGYSYSDIQVRINNVVRSLTSNKEAFSALPDELSHQRKVMFNPILANYGVSANANNQFIVDFRVRKRFYIDDTSNDPNWTEWSPWSSSIKINNMPITYPPTGKDTYIRIAHIVSVDKTVRDMCGAYLPATVTYPSYVVEVEDLRPGDSNGKQIDRKEYDLLYNKIRDVYETVNKYTEYHSTRTDVKFKEPEHLNPIIEHFTSTEAKVVDSDLVDVRVNGRNYLIKLLNYLTDFTKALK